jgi:WD40 repeat protein
MTARLWDAVTGKPIGDPMGHEHFVYSAQFSPDGQRLVTASEDGTARLWDASNGKPIGDPMKHEGKVNSVQFSPDGQRLVTASRDRTAQSWDFPAATKKDTKKDILLLSALSETMGGVTLEGAGGAENFTTLTSEPIGVIRKDIADKVKGDPSELSPLQRFLKWCVADSRTTTISPFSKITVSAWLENRIKEGTVEGLRAALEVDPANTRVMAHLGCRLANYALRQGIDPDEARRARGEADFLTSRALKLAPRNDEIKRLRDEVVQVLKLNSH